MNAAFYESILNGKRMMFWFTSTGKESIIKVIIFKPTEEPDIYEMALGDLNSDGSIDLDKRSDNGDMEEVYLLLPRRCFFF
ncbi:DUF6934 family protein [Dyadobacter sp. 22481]|uniref:DUF6934 family protein n=1 Tax=Dyadobacter sp. 22481 TaxID=3453926 RepID=UPI003F850857